MYIYMIKNKINGKIYIGQCIKDASSSKSYMGSGKILKNAILKYGVHNFEKTILCECSTRDELNKMEIFYIKEMDSITQGYNISSGGNGGNLGEKVNKKISNSVKKLWKSGVYNGVKWAGGCGPVSEETKLKISKAQSGQNGFWYGKHLTEEHKKNISDGVKEVYDAPNSKIRKNHLNSMRNESVRKKISSSMKGRAPWNKGKTNVYSEEVLKKMSISAKNKKISFKTEQTRRKKISEAFSKNHPNSIKIIDTRDGKIYKDGKQFRKQHINHRGNEMTWYKFLKLLNIGVIKKYE